MGADLKLVKAFNDTRYPYKISLNLEGLFKNLHANTLFKDVPGYIEQVMQIEPLRKMDEVRAVMAKGGVEDYCLFNYGQAIHVHLATDDDFMICAAGLQPKQGYKVDLMTFPSDTSNREMKRQRQSLRELFGQNNNVRFLIDSERKVMRASTKNGNDFVGLFGAIRRAEKTYGMKILNMSGSQQGIQITFK